MSKDINQAVREVCLSFPATEEVPSWGSPDFRVNGKTFATYVVNHHGDGRVALWLNAELDVEDEADWHEIEELVLISYRHFALKRMLQALPDQG